MGFLMDKLGDVIVSRDTLNNEIAVLVREHLMAELGVFTSTLEELRQTQINNEALAIQLSIAKTEIVELTAKQSQLLAETQAAVAKLIGLKNGS